MDGVVILAIHNASVKNTENDAGVQDSIALITKPNIAHNTNVSSVLSVDTVGGLARPL